MILPEEKGLEFIRCVRRPAIRVMDCPWLQIYASCGHCSRAWNEVFDHRRYHAPACRLAGAPIQCDGKIERAFLSRNVVDVRG